MAEDTEFWPPPEFLTDYEILMDKTNNTRKYGFRPQLQPNLCFPAELPFHFGSSASSSALNSPVDSAPDLTESEGDEEELLSGLTRQFSRSALQETNKLSYAQQTLEKNWARSGSPKSTLMTVRSWSGRTTVSSNGSPNGPSQVPSPPTSPLGTNNDAWDLIFQAAGQVARLKMSGGEAAKPGGLQCPTRILSSLVHPRPPVRNPDFAFHSNQHTFHTLTQMNQGLRQEQLTKQSSSDCWGLHAKGAWLSQSQVCQNRIARLDGSFSDSGRSGRPCCLPQNNYSLQCQNQQLWSSGSEMRQTFLGGSESGAEVGAKKERVGTGVFLPRRYNSAADSRRRQGSSSAITTKAVPSHLRGLPPPLFNRVFLSDQDLMVQRNAVLGQQKRLFSPEYAMDQEICLPSEWSY